jgi:portal protein
MNEKHEDLLREIRERFALCSEAETRNRIDALDDLRFRNGEQWPDDIKQERKLLRKPMLTVNKLPQHIRQITNDQRQNRPAIQVSAVEDNDTDTAEVYQGIIRHIELSSNADQAYDTAFESACTIGFGFFRVITKYCDEKSFDQDICVQRVRNPFSVYFDPSCLEPDYSDAQFAFIVDKMGLARFKREYPNAESSSSSFDFHALGDRRTDWVSEDEIRVAEYFCIRSEPTKLVLCDNGQVYWHDEVPPECHPVKERMSERVKVCWYKTNGAEILEEVDWAGKWIPIIPVLGDELDVDGQKILSGIVRHAKDPQRMYNYWASAETELIALAPKAPWIMAEGQDEGYEEMWENANTRNYSRLIYKPTTVGQELAPPPSRNNIEPAVAAITQARMMASDDLKSTTGIFDAALGARSNETTGRAILARQQESDTSNFHFVDNLSRAIKHLGRILVDLIPKVYDTPRVMRILGKDDQERTVKINEAYIDDAGVEKIYDLSTGKYDVTVSVGPSYGSKRQQAAEAMLQLTQAAPQLMAVAGDLMVENMDWPGAKAIAARLKKTLPPELADDDKKMPVPPQIQAQLQQMSMMNEQLTMAVNEMTDTINQKQVEQSSAAEIKRMELESREKIAAIQAQVELAKVEMQQAQVVDLEQYKQQMALLQMQINHLYSNESADMQHERDMQSREMDAFYSSAQSDDDAMRQQEMSDQQYAQQVDMSDRQHAQSIDSSERSHAQQLEMKKHEARQQPKKDQKRAA